MLMFDHQLNYLLEVLFPLYWYQNEKDELMMTTMILLLIQGLFLDSHDLLRDRIRWDFHL